MNLGYPNFLQEMADQWDTDTVIHIGDVVDWASISYHEKMPGFDNPALEYPESSGSSADVVQVIPKATIMTSNHDDLPGDR